MSNPVARLQHVQAPKDWDSDDSSLDKKWYQRFDLFRNNSYHVPAPVLTGQVLIALVWLLGKYVLVWDQLIFFKGWTISNSGLVIGMDGCTIASKPWLWYARNLCGATISYNCLAPTSDWFEQESCVLAVNSWWVQPKRFCNLKPSEVWCWIPNCFIWSGLLPILHGFSHCPRFPAPCHPTSAFWNLNGWVIL